ncbi:MAG: N-acetylmuramoyl-L-alanine amidase [Kiritimatiellae bacterium]|nr:N-acetylmuramoyl-L-alanine amidase [Kiritimatiellia bacterium]
MTLPTLIAAVSIAFPGNGQELPYVERAYVIGAVRKGETNVVVNGENVSVYRTGAFATMVDVVEGRNEIIATDVNGGTTNVVFSVGKKPKPPNSNDAPTAKKKYEKLEYAGDEAKAPPAGRDPGEVTIVLDPGHGGGDSGAVSPHGHFEKEANLLLARKVRDELVSLGYKVLMTRDGDSTLVLYDRPRLAHVENADAFVSIHHNAPPADKDPRELRYHAVFAWNEIGERLAKAIEDEISAALGDTLKANGVMHANFAVTRNPEIPSCLVEADFITSPEGEEASWNAGRRVAMAKAIAAGIDAWRRESE